MYSLLSTRFPRGDALKFSFYDTSEIVESVQKNVRAASSTMKKKTRTFMARLHADLQDKPENESVQRIVCAEERSLHATLLEGLAARGVVHVGGKSFLRTFCSAQHAVLLQ